MGVERDLGGRECVKRVYIHTQREDRDMGGERHGRECERGITLQSQRSS